MDTYAGAHYVGNIARNRAPPTSLIVDPPRTGGGHLPETADFYECVGECPKPGNASGNRDPEPFDSWYVD